MDLIFIKPLTVMAQRPSRASQNVTNRASVASCLSKTSASMSDPSVPARLDFPPDFEILSKPLFRIPQHLMRNPLQNPKTKYKRTPSMIIQERKERMQMKQAGIY